MKTRRLWPLSLALSLVHPPCRAQAPLQPLPPSQQKAATVTFYSHGSSWTSGLPGTNRDIYYGNVFDGDQYLFIFRDGFFLHNNRFLSLHLSPGPHTFGASNGKKPKERESLAVVLEPGGQYFIRAQGESEGLPGVFEIQHGRLDLISCADAQKDMANASPLKDKALGKRLRAEHPSPRVDEIGPPPCQ